MSLSHVHMKGRSHHILTNFRSSIDTKIENHPWTAFIFPFQKVRSGLIDDRVVSCSERIINLRTFYFSNLMLRSSQVPSAYMYAVTSWSCIMQIISYGCIIWNLPRLVNTSSYSHKIVNLMPIRKKDGTTFSPWPWVFSRGNQFFLSNLVFRKLFNPLPITSSFAQRSVRLTYEGLRIPSSSHFR